ncbi:MAG: DNA repair protein RecN [Alphaproteobacteria bacterium]|nr:DNA repair protein RecN [Alphaproteobacteria bacterium]
MLQTLHIRHLLLIERLDLNFGTGLNILSGESGAGKSLVLYAISLLLGARFDRSLLRGEGKQASVSGVWSLPPEHPIYARLEDSGIAVDPDEGIIVRRVLGQSSAIYINETPISLRTLGELADDFAEMYGQFAAHRLSEGEYQRQLLDDYAGLAAEVAQSRVCYADWQQAVLALHEGAARHAALQEQAGYIDHALAELQELDLHAGEVEQLQDQRREIRQLTARRAMLVKALDLMYGGGDQGILRQIDQMQSALSAGGDEVIEELICGLERARIELVEAERTIDALVHQNSEDDLSLDDIEERLFRISELARKHRTRPEALMEVQIVLEAQVTEIDELAEEKHHLSVEVDRQRRVLDGLHQDLSAARRVAAQGFGVALNAELPILNMPNAELEAELVDLDEPSPTGRERVHLLMRTQPDSPLRSMLKIVSGGELSRVLLAIALCLSGAEKSTTANPRLPLVFDEIDVGMGGETAAILGQRMKFLARSRQVLAVTHSPQMAASAECHFGVRKSTSAERVNTFVCVLEGTARREEIARMLAGETVTSAARAAAAALLAEHDAAVS